MHINVRNTNVELIECKCSECSSERKCSHQYKFSSSLNEAIRTRIPISASVNVRIIVHMNLNLNTNLLGNVNVEVKHEFNRNFSRLKI